eukprot:gnl/MRDRNA2_/MRDRNA2_93831_c0_seq1.p1 gnl/MRDRNA2_/MRDRNA2_93831_c0~~gnl/MRDRNA2_/MRDRNA2_93831_c0_seq1.p1  ORF type:complete len:170 (-),score=19.02 gnl/MRDRNA2_/MRDRNA2_93831_c0_seq1:30-539(-)
MPRRPQCTPSIPKTDTVIFIDQRESTDDEFISVTDPRALAAHTFWHRQTGNFWAAWTPDDQLEEEFTGELYAVQALTESPWPGSLVTLRFCRHVDVGKWFEIMVQFEVMDMTPTSYFVKVVAEKGNYGYGPTLSNTTKATGTISRADVLYTKTTGGYANHTARVLFPAY